MTIIGLDGGHGLYTAGKQTPTGIKEWTLNDDVCDRIEKILADYDCIVIRTDHNEGNVDEPLSQRVREYLNKKVKSLTSIHHNAHTGTWNGATGVEVYTDRTPIPGDDKLANLMYQKITTYTGLKGRGVKRANFTVIDQDKVPAVLVEGGFMDSTIDYKVITSEAGKNAYARAVAESLIEFHNLKRKAASKIEVEYRAYTHGKSWQGTVKAGQTAGIIGIALECLQVRLSKGNVWYSLHVPTTKTKKARWLPEVKNWSDYAGNYGQAADGVKIRTDTGKTISYAVHEKASNRWLPAVTGCNANDSRNGYAGNLNGRVIDGIRIWIE